MDEYNISEIYKEMENYLIESMMRNMKRHTNWENTEDFQWDAWQVRQLEALEEYRKRNLSYVNKRSNTVNIKLEELIKQSYAHGGMEEEIKILNAIKKGAKLKRIKGIDANFFKINDRKLSALIKATQKDLTKAAHAMLRKSNDEYRKVIHKAAMFANTGTTTVGQAIDMATKDFVKKGINCIQYANGRVVNINTYAEMAIRTANKRGYLSGEGDKRKEWGIHTVLVSQYGACSPTCLPWQGKVYVDDVWSGGTAKEAEEQGYPLLSQAVADGLYHPNCKHSHTTYFPGITEMPKAADVAKTQENSQAIAQQRYNERQIRSYKRLEENTLDPDNREKYATQKRFWQAKQRKLVEDTDGMKRDYKRESIKGKGYGTSQTKTKTEEKAKVESIKTDHISQFFGEDYTNSLNKTISNSSSENVKKLWNKYADDLHVCNMNFKGTPHCRAIGKPGILINNTSMNERSITVLKARGPELVQRKGEVVLHEFGHNIDILKARATPECKNIQFTNFYKSTKHQKDGIGYTLGDMLREEAKTNIDTKLKMMKANQDEWLDRLGVAKIRKYHAETEIIMEMRELPLITSSDVSDIWEGATKGKVKAFSGHGVKYWENIDVGVEAFAEMFSATIMNPESLEQIKKYFPKSHEIFEEIIEEMLK
ncbi:MULTISPECIES: phage minor capsid protein [unclassified Breznakia]|uniref:phage minor capsid protein n=1 Tax=unclassified Breznakia TaxID=2623764 RepID=UPI0024737E4D|nr:MULTISPECIES: phage minor capsid protein [unclassified Breznakia]MDH6367547.1 hypothetical protein [Breznakia sp. PH1-1]MDH6404659.1 hypothetical protein [Breznakia sp. PF1-11]MDH6412377.1 hypothetical protein [Breznakia sp. PFB1-11]MDH6414715.1 hypothetical protein [Breznakia sp. PFB1-14]MDH6417040.1 hypothetical protein [Breznakia sp. PFB1-4]